MLVQIITSVKFQVLKINGVIIIQQEHGRLFIYCALNIHGENKDV